MAIAAAGAFSDHHAMSDFPEAARTLRGPGRRLHGSIAHRIGVAILSGEHAPGDILSGEVAFSEQLDVSRGAYREAMQALAAKGLVESRPKTGTRVLPRHRWNLLDPAVLAWAFAGEPDPRLVRSLFELRAVIEPAAARMAAERRSDEELAQMKAALDLMDRHTLATDEGRAADRDFHDLILKATQNDALTTLSASIGAAVNWTTEFKQRARDLPRNPIPDHARVYDAIAAQDGAAAEAAMRDLVTLALDDTHSAMTPQP
ncbi:FadR/GntR family transcriptional regulator [Brevundimonas sp. Leaf363]|uniref:FadR/GntR family transcriptional regulator n=1 Tax=Brevundimonas sp. Leaf363 TaxID=1736353 RepID=UPI0035102A0E